MRELRELPLDLVLYTSVKAGNAPIGSMRAQLLPAWRRSTRSIGGYWQGTTTFLGEDFAKLDMFQSALTWEIREMWGNLITWQGFLIGMVLTVDGLQYTRRWIDLANRVQVIYTRLGDNLLTNGSVETGAWANYNAPISNVQSSTWVADGAMSEYIVTAANSGAVIQTGITIVALKAYDAQLTANLEAGTWRLEVYRTDTDARLAAVDEPAPGQKVMRCTIPETSTYAGTVGVRFYCTAGPGVGNASAYADGATFRESPVQGRTAWTANDDSVKDYGTLETALLVASMSDGAANGQASTYLNKQAFPRVIAPGEYGSKQAAPTGVSLDLTFAGYVFTTRNKYVARPATTQNASVHVTNLLADTEFVSAGVVETNTMQWQLEDRAPLRVWEVLRDIARAGNTAGDRWTAGVYNERKFDYQAASTVPDYHYKGGEVYSLAGAPLEPWLVRPGLMYLDDLPAGPGDLTGRDADDPHTMFIEEVEFDAADWLAGNSGVNFRREAGSDVG